MPVTAALGVGHQLFMGHWFYLPQAFVLTIAVAFLPRLLDLRPRTCPARCRTFWPKAEAAGGTPERLAKLPG